MSRLTKTAPLGLLFTLIVCALAGCGPKDSPATKEATREQIPANVDPATGKERAK